MLYVVYNINLHNYMLYLLFVHFEIYRYIIFEIITINFLYTVFFYST